MIIKYYIKNVYGTKRKYLADKKQQKKLTPFTQNNHLNRKLEKGLKNLGHKFQQVLASN